MPLKSSGRSGKKGVAMRERSIATAATLNGRLEPAQHTAARIVGFLYLFLMATAILAESYARGQIIVPGDAVHTAMNIAASEWLFRASAVTHLLTVAGDIVLVVALYVILKPVNQYVALLAAFWRLAESSILAVTSLNDFAALVLLSGADYLRALDTEQLQALAYTLIRVRGTGFGVGFAFLGLGSALFSYLWFRSRYIPRGFAAWGVFASMLLATGSLAILVFPRLAAIMGMVHMAPMFVYEVGLGVWLLAKGIQAPTVE
jgi:hypothetical protein